MSGNLELDIHRRTENTYAVDATCTFLPSGNGILATAGPATCIALCHADSYGKEL